MPDSLQFFNLPDWWTADQISDFQEWVERILADNLLAELKAMSVDIGRLPETDTSEE